MRRLALLLGLFPLALAVSGCDTATDRRTGLEREFRLNQTTVSPELLRQAVDTWVRDTNVELTATQEEQITHCLRRQSGYTDRHLIHRILASPLADSGLLLGIVSGVIDGRFSRLFWALCEPYERCRDLSQPWPPSLPVTACKDDSCTPLSLIQAALTVLGSPHWDCRGVQLVTSGAEFLEAARAFGRYGWHRLDSAALEPFGNNYGVMYAGYTGTTPGATPVAVNALAIEPPVIEWAEDAQRVTLFAFEHRPGPKDSMADPVLVRYRITFVAGRFNDIVRAPVHEWEQFRLQSWLDSVTAQP